MLSALVGNVMLADIHAQLRLPCTIRWMQNDDDPERFDIDIDIAGHSLSLNKAASEIGSHLDPLRPALAGLDSKPPDRHWELAEALLEAVLGYARWTQYSSDEVEITPRMTPIDVAPSPGLSMP